MSISGFKAAVSHRHTCRSTPHRVGLSTCRNHEQASTDVSSPSDVAGPPGVSIGPLAAGGAQRLPAAASARVLGEPPDVHAATCNLTTFLEDDTAPQVLPMEISVVDLKGDGLRYSPSDFEPSPIRVHVDTLVIHRRDDGAFSISGAEARRRSQSEDSVLCSVPADADVKQMQIQAPSASPHPSTRENMLMEENDCLKVALSWAKMALAEVQLEREALRHQMKTFKVTNTS
ncbi:bridge-like lipid transfer protein family member 3B isoform X2 [Dunckerocampus dactyliophorus]|nr:bridge-like lipid transfer protein family member 3B isoform X2 [Dunckerocampus dactyliophorus]XP_054608912.1 bridge-like lipid transfer protein family member 3B isoform X2 [Dunckerocampus dactyliophorus]XP_054608914.1 bridge-like lipid transfer protein family member 3B isoform X2 [Dunckerocampus dactyliophorus]XP_054608915.1 bridge-like lipid transfer protein family member 3B isoform X2 [Dunckerocampus dactyliophorus]XP_054608916.1 bridge-like lipid transfer protein family member 3B isoform 